MVRHVSQSSVLCNPEGASRADPKTLTPQATHCDQTPESEHPPPAPSSPSQREHPRRPLKAWITDTGGWSTQNPDVIGPRPDERALDFRNMSVDLEKQDFARSDRSSRSGTSKSTLDDEMCAQGQEEENEQLLEQNALKILIYLLGICEIVSLSVAVWTVVALIVTILLQPVRLFSRRQAFRQQLVNLLAPALRLQLSLIYAELPTESFDVTLLVLTHLLSPLVSIGVGIAALIALVFWFYAGILGDPNGSDRPQGYNDGRAFVLAIRNWWKGWLMRSIPS